MNKVLDKIVTHQVCQIIKIFTQTRDLEVNMGTYIEKYTLALILKNYSLTN